MALKLWVYLYRNLCLSDSKEALLSKRIITYSTMVRLVSQSVFSHVARRPLAQNASTSCIPFFILSGTLGLHYKHSNVMTIPPSLDPSECGADSDLLSQRAAFGVSAVKLMDGELNSISVTERQTDPRSFPSVRTRGRQAFHDSSNVHLSNRIGGPNLLN